GYRVSCLAALPRHACAARLAPRLALDGRKTRRKLRHDRAAFVRAVERPGADFVARAAATETVAGHHVDRTDEHAGRFHRVSGRCLFGLPRSRLETATGALPSLISAAQSAKARAKSTDISASCCVAPIVSPVWPPILRSAIRLKASTAMTAAARARTRAIIVP